MSNTNSRALIFDAKYVHDGYAGVLSVEYLVGETANKIEICVEHPMESVRTAGHQAFKLLLRACNLPRISDTSELLEKEISLRAIADIDAIIAGDSISLPNGKSQERYVYVISCVDTPEPLCKIGIAQSPERRLKTLATASPHKLRLEMTRNFQNARAVEVAAHHQFRQHRVSGEWFKVDAATIADFLNTQEAA